MEKTLKELRNSKGLTLVSASAEIGISTSLLSKLENGLVPLTDEVAVKLEAFYETKIVACKLPYQQELIELKKNLELEKKARITAENENKELKKLLNDFKYSSKRVFEKITEFENTN